jgi:hypothetical protein
MTIKRFSISVKAVVASTFLLVLTGCTNWFSTGKKTSSSNLATKDVVKTSSGPKIVEFSDGSSMSMTDIDAEIAKILSANPYTKAMKPSDITPDMKELFFRDVMNRKLIELWAEENKIDSNDQFKDEVNQTFQLLVQAKKGEWFSNELRTKISDMVSDKDVKKAYDQNQSRYVKTAGGVKTSAVRFANKDEAKAFLDSIDVTKVASAKDFEEVARNATGGMFRDFGRISDSSPRGASRALVDEATSRRSFPSIELVKVGEDEYWVALFEDNKESVFFSFDEVKDQIRTMAENEKFAALAETEIKNLEKRFVKTIDNSVFKSAATPDTALDDSVDNE